MWLPTENPGAIDSMNIMVVLMVTTMMMTTMMKIRSKKRRLLQSKGESAFEKRISGQKVFFDLESTPPPPLSFYIGKEFPTPDGGPHIRSERF